MKAGKERRRTYGDFTTCGPIIAKLSSAPGNGAPIGGLKVVAANGWFAAGPSGKENIYKTYAESFKDEKHLNAIVSEAQSMVGKALQYRLAEAST